jgi:hypothetical protein
MAGILAEDLVNPATVEGAMAYAVAFVLVAVDSDDLDGGWVCAMRLRGGATP